MKNFKDVFIWIGVCLALSIIIWIGYWRWDSNLHKKMVELQIPICEVMTDNPDVVKSVIDTI